MTTKRIYLTDLITRRKWVLECARPLEVTQPAWLALPEQHSPAAKWVLNSILLTVLQSRVFLWNVTRQHNWCCDITVCVFTLQLLHLNNFIHCKFILIENKKVTSTLQRKSKTAWFILHHLMEEVSCFSQKEGLVLSTTRSSKKKTSENTTENLLKGCFHFWQYPFTLHDAVYVAKCSALSGKTHLVMNLAAAEHRTVCFILILLCLVKSATTDSTIKRLVGTASFSSIYIHILLLKNMEGSQRSQFKDNFQVNTG